MRALLLVLLVHCVNAQTLALTGCTVIDVRSGAVRSNRTLVIRDERIAAEGSAGATRIPLGARIVQASGKFVIPGLWDMHVHVGEIEEDWFPLYLANGVTGLREMAAAEKNVPKQRQYQQDVAGGRRIGPELFWTHFSMDAPAIETAQQARAEVARRAAMGTRYIKVYNGLSREAYFAIADECQKRGLQMVGHVPDRVSVREAARAHQSSIEHLDGILLACSRNEAEARWLIERNRYPWAMLLDTFDAAKMDALIDTLRESGVWQTPTLTIYRIAALAGDRALPGSIPVEFARRDYLQSWPREALAMPFPGIDAAVARRMLVVYKDLVRRMQQRGVRILAGTDTPYAYCVPGFALHDELALLNDAGLTPAETLRTATWNAAEFLGELRDYGSIEPGKIADLLLLDANPLVAIANSSRIHAVVRHGHLIDSAALRTMLEEVRKRVATERPALPAKK